MPNEGDLPKNLDWKRLQSGGYPELMASAKLEEGPSREYYHLQTIVDGYNKDCLTVKSWSVTVSAVALGAAIQYNQPALALLSALTSLAFWLTEGYWRGNQSAFIKRIRCLELRRHDYSPMISYSWERFFPTWGWLGAEGCFQFRSAIPHLLILTGALLVYFCHDFAHLESLGRVGPPGLH